jgi:ABC-type multidrug transport system fused ATPase/permease subunit
LCRALLAVTGAGVAGAAAWGVFHLVRLLASVPRQEWTLLAAALGATFLRTAGALAVATLWTVPAGVLIGRSAVWSRRLQPVAQLVASFPAPMIFPLVTAVLLACGVPFAVIASALMLLGAQWYVLFNVLAGATSVPHDLEEASATYRLVGAEKWKKLFLPAVFPYLVTGLITAAGGADANGELPASCGGSAHDVGGFDHSESRSLAAAVSPGRIEIRSEPMTRVASSAPQIASEPPIAQTIGVTKSYADEAGREHIVLRDVDFGVRKGETVAVLGPSGCGKSTLLRILIGLIPATSGLVKEHGEPLVGIHPGAAVVFQNFALFPWLTVEENVRVGLNGEPLAEDDARTRVAGAISPAWSGRFRRSFPEA